MRLIAAALLIIAALAGCDNGGDETVYYPVVPTCTTVTVTAATIGTTQVITIDKPTHLSIEGINNMRTIEGGGYLCSMNVEGINNLARFNVAMRVDKCTLDGSDNLIERPASMPLSCTDSGIGNTLTTY